MNSDFCFRSRELDFDYSTKFRYERIKTFVSLGWTSYQLALKEQLPTSERNLRPFYTSKNTAGTIYLLASEFVVPVNTDMGRGNIFPAVFKQYRDWISPLRWKFYLKAWSLDPFTCKYEVHLKVQGDSNYCWRFRGLSFSDRRQKIKLLTLLCSHGVEGAYAQPSKQLCLVYKTAKELVYLIFNRLLENAS
jgi:hypothetical protein